MGCLTVGPHTSHCTCGGYKKKERERDLTGALHVKTPLPSAPCKLCPFLSVHDSACRATFLILVPTICSGDLGAAGRLDTFESRATNSYIRNWCMREQPSTVIRKSRQCSLMPSCISTKGDGPRCNLLSRKGFELLGSIQQTVIVGHNR
jgi:hypothetical protein